MFLNMLEISQNNEWLLLYSTGMIAALQNGFTSLENTDRGVQVCPRTKANFLAQAICVEQSLQYVQWTSVPSSSNEYNLKKGLSIFWADNVDIEHGVLWRICKMYMIIRNVSWNNVYMRIMSHLLPMVIVYITSSLVIKMGSPIYGSKGCNGKHVVIHDA